MVRRVRTKGKKRSGLKIRQKARRAPSDKELYKLLSAAAKVLYGPSCEICGNLGSQAMHFHSKKGHPSVKFDLRNILWACTKCHIFDSHMRNDTEHARRTLLLRLGQEEFDRLFTDAHNGAGKLTVLDRDNIKGGFLHILSGTSDIQEHTPARLS